MNITQWDIPNDRQARVKAIHYWFAQDDKSEKQSLSADFQGGRTRGLEKLNAVNGEAYGKTRNFTDGAVTHLSPYFRHGCISLPEAVEKVRTQFGQSAEKLLNEFAWREYWRTVWYAHGDAIMIDMQPPQIVLAYGDLPTDLQTASTGLPCIDHFASQLLEEGYLHNHARMWLAAYTVHWRHTDWQQGAQWMHDQLLDGDYASNHLSWQWVSSTFSRKPYFFNQENLAKYTKNKHCDSCEAKCPFRDSYTNLEQQLFKPSQQLAREHIPIEQPHASSELGDKILVWIHDEILNNEHDLLQLTHEKVFIFDPYFYQDWSINRLHFIADCLIEMPNVTVWIGQTSAVFKHLKTQHIITQDTPNQQLKQLVAEYPVTWQPEQKVCTNTFTSEQLTSFSKFWKVASHDFIGASNKKKMIRHRG